MKPIVLIVLVCLAVITGCGEEAVTPRGAASDTLDAARVERVLDAFPRFLTWARAVETRGNRLQERIDLKNPGGWIDATRFEAELADGAGFTSAVGMPADEFFRDWALLAAAYGAVVASDGLAIARAEMRKLLERPDLPAEQRALVTHQLEEMRIEAPTAPAANQELVRRYRARLDALLSATER